ncbi:MAG: pyridoxal phosphate-dependent aminotransferase [Eggerthellaceae bacterium]|nr:pyridoxal phosphate-dependent aminotransferase [Eggerthellaceae bacterium]
MINESMYAWGSEPSAIRQLFAYGLERKKAIGADKVFDFSLGNPNVPTPQVVTDTLKALLERSPETLHGYTPAQGDSATRQAVANEISKRFEVKASPDSVYMTVGAAASISISLAAVSHPGDEIIVNAPYFPEYRVWATQAGCKVVEVATKSDDFSLDTKAIADAITPKTSAIIVNSPNNPVGTVYSKQNLIELARVLEQKQKETGHPIYLISDEPYREIVYTETVPYVPSIYARTLVCYSYSKSLSLPGERIGYVYVSDEMDKEEHDKVFLAVCGAGRALGYVCAPALFQKAIAECVNVPSGVAAYAKNRKLLTEGLSALGYEYIEPKGAFYLWVKALEDDAKAFSEKAKQFELLIVPSDSFGVKGWVRISYCVSPETIVNSMPAFEALMKAYR